MVHQRIVVIENMENKDENDEVLTTENSDCNNLMTSVKDGLQTGDNVSTDHVCERNYNDVLNIPSNDDGDRYTCGGCAKKLATICRLHEHMLKEFISGSFIYDHPTKTAHTKVECVSIGTQTESVTVRHKPLKSDLSQSESFTKRKNTTRTRNRKLKSSGINKISLSRESKRTKLKVSKNKPIKQVTEHQNVSEDSYNEFENSPEVDEGKHSDIAVDDVYNESTDKEDNVQTDISNVNATINDINIESEDGLDKMNEPDEKKFGSCKVKGNKRSSKTSSKHSEEKKRCLKIRYEDDDSDNEEIVIKETPKRPGRPRIKAKKILCDHCDYSFNSERKLNIHIVGAHSQLYPYCCVPCNRKPFKTKEEFLEHKEHHPVQIYKCELCCKELRSKEGLRLHTLAHSGVKAYMCDQCDYKGRTAAQLRQHQFNHMETKTEQCEHCGKAFFTKGKLREHIRYCRKEFNHHCSYCQKGFPTASGLRKHVLMHTGERAFVCDVCGFATFRTSLLKSHMRTHTGEKPYKCKFCGAKLASRGTLRLHERTHTHEKPFVCAFCNKAFTSKWNLKTHLRQHTGETPYKCDICGQGFKQNVLRKSHMRCHMETIEPGGPSLHMESLETPGPNMHRMNEPSAMDMQHIPREPVLVDNPSHRLLEPSHTPGTVIHEHYSQSENETCGKDSLQTSEHSNHILPLDLKLHYSSGEFKNIYTTSVPSSSNTVLSNSFNMINYSN